MPSKICEQDPVLGRIINVLVGLYSPDRIYLFGSKARGNFGPDSDYDIMVVVPNEAPSELRRAGRAHEALWSAGITEPADILIWTKEQFDSTLHLKASLSTEVASEGALLYAA